MGWQLSRGTVLELLAAWDMPEVVEVAREHAWERGIERRWWVEQRAMCASGGGHAC